MASEMVRYRNIKSEEAESLLLRSRCCVRFPVEDERYSLCLTYKRERTEVSAMWTACRRIARIMSCPEGNSDMEGLHHVRMWIRMGTTCSWDQRSDVRMRRITKIFEKYSKTCSGKCGPTDMP